jgi:hypothetical protein
LERKFFASGGTAAKGIIILPLASKNFNLTDLHFCITSHRTFGAERFMPS